MSQPPGHTERSRSVITPEKLALLKKLKITRVDIWNFKNKRFKKIGKKRFNMIKLIIENDLISSKQFIPFNKLERESEWILIIRNPKSQIRNTIVGRVEL